VTWRVGPVPPASILVIVDAYEGTQSSIALLSGLVAGTLSRVSIAGDARTVAPVIEAGARGERVPVSVERWQIVAGTVPADSARSVEQGAAKMTLEGPGGKRYLVYRDGSLVLPENGPARMADLDPASRRIVEALLAERAARSDAAAPPVDRAGQDPSQRSDPE
jgi:hypothetical protein